MTELGPVLVRLPPDLHDALKATAQAEDRSMAAVVRVALRQYVEQAA